MSRIAEMSRITFWVNIYGFPKFNFSKNQFLSELDFHGVPPTNGIFLPTPQPQRLCHQLKYLSPFNVSKFLGIFTIWYEAHDSSHDSIKNPKLRWTLNQNVVGVSLRNETFTLNMKLVTKWDLKSSLSEHDRGRPWLTAV